MVRSRIAKKDLGIGLNPNRHWKFPEKNIDYLHPSIDEWEK